MNNIKTTSLDPSLEVNHLARRHRHLKVFSKPTVVKMHLLDFLKWIYSPIDKFFHNKFFQSTVRFFECIAISIAKTLPILSPQKKIILQSALLGGAIFLVGSLSPGVGVNVLQMTYSSVYLNEYSLPGDVLVSDENGYLVKINPQTDKASRVGMTDYAVHTVEGGQSLSVIAETYGLNVETIMWENKLANANSLRVGQKLVIPPVNGLSYKVVAGDTLDKLATKYKIEKAAIIAQNDLEGEALIKGQSLFLPGAKQIAPVNVASANSQARAGSAGGTRSYAGVSSSSATPSVGKIFIYPTKGSISQYYRAGHYAIDIADRSRPPVWAAGSGTIEKASSGTWGGGYGNHIIINHGDGMKTLYAHLDSLNVYEGQAVNQGDVIGIMGNTGRVYGATGIHLHWEVIDNGVKRNPTAYY
ncbi:MAG: M23 family metallopeptidase [Candidatus Gracilibacteria bacterium]|nr:M23 family metallopeptidase [Candidatus Gracilibacteria bacterium]